MSKAIDPICGMDVDQTKARAAGLASEYENTTYYFCAPGCKQRFDAERRAAPTNHARPPAGVMPAMDTMEAKSAKSTLPAKDAAAAAVDQIPATATDPICGMEVDIETARAAGLVSVHEGMSYHFCSPGCKKRFDADPTASLSSGR